MTLAKPVHILLTTIVLATSTPAFSQVIALACQGQTSRDEGSNKITKTPLAASLVLDLTFGKIASSSLNCWAGKGDCTQLKISVGEKTISASGSGDLMSTGLFTHIEIDRRSGFLTLRQGQDASASRTSNPASLAKSEQAELICQGGQRPMF